jgi:type IV pilus assembly protein PilQ
MLVGNAEEIAEQERIELEANKQIIELLPLQTEHFKILYAKADTLSQMLSVEKNGVLSDRGSVLVDERTNSMIITDTARNLTEVRDLIELLDVPVKQIMIEARIVSANDDFSRELGIRWGGANMSDSAVVTGDLETANDISGQIVSRSQEFNSAVAGGTNANQAAADLAPITTAFPGANFVDLGVGGAPSSIALSYLGSAFNVSAELSALESNGQGEVVSQPKVITGDKKQASIKAGQEVGFQQATASGATSVSFKEAVLQLDVTPNITPDNRILMDLVVTQDTISGFVSGENNSQIPVIDTTEVATQVLMNNGETIVLGGVFEQTDLYGVSKTPLLGDLPIIGRAFKRTTTTQVKRETLIFITPRIINESLSN